MGLLDRISSAASDVIDTARDAAEEIQTTATNAANEVAETATEIASDVKETAQDVGNAIQDTASSAAQWGSHMADQGAQMLKDKLGIRDEGVAEGVEGGANSSVKNSGDPNEKVDLGSPGKIHDFLKTYGQKDQVGDTQSDMARCQSNVMIAGMLVKGGTPALRSGLEKAKADAQDQLKTATGGKKIALENALKNFDKAIEGLESGNVTRGDLDRAADAMFHTMIPPTTKGKDGKDVPSYDEKGDLNPTTGIDKDRINEMEQKIGLATGKEQEVGEYFALNPASWWTDDDREVSNEVWEKIPDGQSAHVAVNLWGEHTATGKGPDGEKVETTSSGRPYYIEKGTGDWKFLDKKTNHAVLFGKTPDGNRYIYNPMGDPPYMAEPQASAAQIDAMSSKLMATKYTEKGERKDGDFRARVTTFG